MMNHFIDQQRICVLLNKNNVLHKKNTLLVEPSILFILRYTYQMESTKIAYAFFSKVIELYWFIIHTVSLTCLSFIFRNEL